MTFTINEQSLQAWLHEQREAHGVVGCTVGVLRDGEIEMAGSGLLNVETGVEVTADALFQIGSISKVFTATQILQLQDAGRLNIDDRVRIHLPEFRVADSNVADALTIRQLLNHTSGIEGDFFPPDDEEGGSAAGYVQKMTLLPQLAPSGLYMTYCNSGWVVLGRIVEKLTGLSWASAVRRDVLEPCGMTRAFADPREALRHRCAIGHAFSGADAAHLDVVEQPYLPSSLAAAGSMLMMDVSNLLGFAKVHLDGGHLAGGGRLLSPHAVELMQKVNVRLPEVQTRSAINAWGLGWAIADHPEVFSVGHDGGTVGQLAYLRLIPERRFAIAMLTNSVSTGLWELFETTVLRENFGIEYPAYASDPGWSPEPRRYQGCFANLAGTQRVDCVDGQWSLTTQSLGMGGGPPEVVRLRPKRKDVFETIPTGATSSAEILFLEDDIDGRAVFLRQGVRMSRRSE